VQDQPNQLDDRVRQLEESVERLTSANLSLKLELATLISALQDSPFPQTARRMPVLMKPVAIEPPVRPSMTPAAIVVMLAVGLLSWQLIAPPQLMQPPLAQVEATSSLAQPLAPVVPAFETAATAPPITPLVRPTIYKGTLSVNADHAGATVFVNRQNVGTAPVRVRNLRAGAHLVWIEREGYRRWTRVVTVPAERVTRVTADLEPVGPGH
jgi:hypothetical protein